MNIDSVNFSGEGLVDSKKMKEISGLLYRLEELPSKIESGKNFERKLIIHVPLGNNSIRDWKYVLIDSFGEKEIKQIYEFDGKEFYVEDLGIQEMEDYLYLLKKQ